jgi:hypothetical protein
MQLQDVDGRISRLEIRFADPCWYRETVIIVSFFHQQVPFGWGGMTHQGYQWEGHRPMTHDDATSSSGGADWDAQNSAVCGFHLSDRQIHAIVERKCLTQFAHFTFLCISQVRQSDWGYRHHFSALRHTVCSSRQLSNVAR